MQDIEWEKAIERERSEVGVVFWVSAAVALAFILWGVIAPESFGAVTQAVFDWVVSNLGWFYLLAGNFFLIFVVILALSRYGKFRLGKEDERPEFSTFAWFAMLFQAGMGPALIFWGVAEPLSHYCDPPFGLAKAGTTEAAQVGMQYSDFHWTLHPWASITYPGPRVARPMANLPKDYEPSLTSIISSATFPCASRRTASAASALGASNRQ